VPEHSKQHFIPRSYLAAWCDPATPEDQEPYVWRFPKDGGEGKRKAPHKLFTETEMYTLHAPDGSRDLRLEHGLADLEDAFARVRAEKISHRLPLTAADEFVVYAFIAAMHSRTPKQRDHWKEQWQGILDDMKSMRDQVRKMTPAQRKNIPPSIGSGGPSMGIEEVEQLATNPVPVLLISGMQQLLPGLMQFNLAILTTGVEAEFITSDAPCAWFDPEVHRRPFPYNSIGLMYPTVEITLPLGPGELGFLSRKDLSGYVPIPGAIVDDLNRRTRAYAHEYFVTSKNEVKDIWFDMGSPPEENTPR
jgi:hypothetical protein